MSNEVPHGVIGVLRACTIFGRFKLRKEIKKA